MQIAFACPQCERSIHATVSPETGKLCCANCHWTRDVSPADVADAGPQRCLACGCTDLWRQKDFPQALGVGMVAAGALSFAVAMAYYMPIIAITILLGFAAIDLVLYVYMPDVLVCYRCQARHRHAAATQTPGFQLETFERYRQEAARLGK